MKPRYFITERLHAEARACRADHQWTPRQLRRIQHRAHHSQRIEFAQHGADAFSHMKWRVDGYQKGAQPQPYQQRWLEALERDLVPEGFDLQPGGTDMHQVWLDPRVGAIRRPVISRAEFEREYPHEPTEPSAQALADIEQYAGAIDAAQEPVAKDAILDLLKNRRVIP